MSAYQTIILSGGGAKGPYGLGVLLALEKFHRERKKEFTKIYCGTSVGALNAALAAQGNLKQLTALYSQISTKDILGVDDAEVRRLTLAWVADRKPFHYFENTALKTTIKKYASFDMLANADRHLIICATNYRTGNLETFYISKLVDEFIEGEQSIDKDRRQLLNFHRIKSQEELVQALLASAAIPFYFPPVEISGSLFVDGGVANNTPLRQAAYINRFLSRKADTQIEPTFCVINDPSRFTIEQGESIDIFGVVRRTMDIFNNELVNDDCESWERINGDVDRAENIDNLLSSHLGSDLKNFEENANLRQQIKEVLLATKGGVARVKLPLLIVRPSTHLLDNPLHFDSAQANTLRRHGTADCLNVLYQRNFISSGNNRQWNEEIE